MIRNLGLALLGLTIACGAARAEPTGVNIELNKLEPHDTVCRAYLILKNSTESAFEALKLDLVMFDADGIVAKRLAVEAAPLPSHKTSLKVFDIDDMPCDSVGRVLLNGDLSCADSTGQRNDCLALISTSARGSVPFIK